FLHRRMRARSDSAGLPAPDPARAQSISADPRGARFQRAFGLRLSGAATFLLLGLVVVLAAVLVGPLGAALGAPLALIWLACFTGTGSGGMYGASASRHRGWIVSLFRIRQATTCSRSGMYCEQTWNALSMQAWRCSGVSASAPSAPNVRPPRINPTVS